MKLLSLDLGRHVGYAVFEIDIAKPLDPGWMNNLEQNGIRIVQSGCLNFMEFDVSEFYHRFYEELEGIIQQHSIDVVTYECIEFIKYRYASQIQFGLEAIVLLLCGKHEITVIPQGVGKIKKFICGSGRAVKREVIKKILNVLKKNNIVKQSITEHEADSLSCGLLTIEMMKQEISDNV